MKQTRPPAFAAPPGYAAADPLVGVGDVNKMVELIKEVMWWHSDPKCAEYNECDKSPCFWCEQAKKALPPNGPDQTPRP